MVSVCIPVYNGEKYIGDAIRSVLLQGYPNMEILIQDNASTDKTWRLVRSLAQQYPQLSLERNETNVGMAPNWNMVINRASGDYIMLLSADDLLGPDFLTACFSVFQDPRVEVVTTNHFLLKKEIETKRKVPVAGGIYKNFAGRVLLLNPFSINFSLFRRDTIERLKRERNLFRESFFTCDYDLWIRVALSGIGVHYIEQPLGAYRVHETNLSRQVVRMNRQAALTVLSHKKALKNVCNIAYRTTLARFMMRFIIHALALRAFSKRILSVLVRELFSPGRKMQKK